LELDDGAFNNGDARPLIAERDCERDSDSDSGDCGNFFSGEEALKNNMLEELLDMAGMFPPVPTDAMRLPGLSESDDKVIETIVCRFNLRDSIVFTVRLLKVS
jgi:hypothetical protein